MSSWILPVILHIMAICIGVTEIFLPSMGILTILALGLMGYALYLVFNTFSLTVFYAILGGDLILIPIAFILGLKVLEVSPLSLKKKLAASQGFVSQSPDLDRYLDCTGHTLTTLRPAGAALMNGVRLDVVSDGDFIEANTPVRVCKITGNQVIVCRQDKDANKDLVSTPT